MPINREILNDFRVGTLRFLGPISLTDLEITPSRPEFSAIAAEILHTAGTDRDGTATHLAQAAAALENGRAEVESFDAIGARIYAGPAAILGDTLAAETLQLGRDIEKGERLLGVIAREEADNAPAVARGRDTIDREVGRQRRGARPTFE